MILQSTIKGQIIPAPTYVCWKSKFHVFDNAFNPSVGKDANPPAQSHTNVRDSAVAVSTEQKQAYS